MVRRVARWLVVAASSVVLGLALIAGAAYWHFLHSGPPPSVWHRVALADFAEEQADQVRTLDGYLRLEQELFDELQERVYGAVPPGGEIVASRREGGEGELGWGKLETILKLNQRRYGWDIARHFNIFYQGYEQAPKSSESDKQTSREKLARIVSIFGSSDNCVGKR